MRTVSSYDQANYIVVRWYTKEWLEYNFENKILNEAYSILQSKLKEVCDNHIPTKTVVIRPNDKPFMNNSIRGAIRKRDRALYRAKKKKKKKKHK